MKPIVLCILDGFGFLKTKKGNAIAAAHTPCLDKLFQLFPHSLLEASGEYVGLPNGQIGNSEVGHLTIGAGRVMLQTLPRINQAIDTKVFKMNNSLIKTIAYLKDSKRPIHFVGLLSGGGVHSSQEHAFAYAQFFLEEGVDVIFHVILDGRDTAPCVARDSLNILQKKLPKARIETCCGRYYAMDRDNNIERTEKAYRAIIFGEGIELSDEWIIAINKVYQLGITDEFFQPLIKKGYLGAQVGDGLFLFNFRADRMRQIANKLVQYPFFQPLSMTEYDSSFRKYLTPLFLQENISNSFGEVIALQGMQQLRLAETEKYAHVTFFFNGGLDTVFPGEDRILVPSKKVKTYDLYPQMSAVEITDQLLCNLSKYDVILVNYANADMVGHTGIMDATILAIESLDLCLERVFKEVTRIKGTLIITADHGNAECMFDQYCKKITSHTLNPVPFIICCNNIAKLHNGSLADVAPTILGLMNIVQPSQMTGSDLRII